MTIYDQSLAVICAENSAVISMENSTPTDLKSYNQKIAFHLALTPGDQTPES
jgi:hypothetical protein